MASDTNGAGSVTDSDKIKIMSVFFTSADKFHEKDSNLPRFSMLCESRASKVCKL